MFCARRWPKLVVVLVVVGGLEILAHVSIRLAIVMVLAWRITQGSRSNSRWRSRPPMTLRLRVTYLHQALQKHFHIIILCLGAHDFHVWLNIRIVSNLLGWLLRRACSRVLLLLHLPLLVLVWLLPFLLLFSLLILR